MSEPEERSGPPNAWQPVTPRGVAAFAYTTFTRVLLVQFVVALLVAFAALAAAMSQWFPVIEQAIRNAPAETAIRNASLISGTAGPARLAGNRALEIILDPRHDTASGGSADVTVFLTEKEVLLCSMAGCASLPYVRGYDLDLQRQVAEPWWGAWSKAIAAGIVASVIITLMAAWWIGAALLAPVLRLTAFFMDRVLSTGGSWRLAAAALLPGAALLIVGLALYAAEAIDLTRLALFLGVNVVCGLFFASVTPLFLDPIAPRKKNPFKNKPEPGGDKKKKARANPFGRE